jgi:hypothetical protein
MSFDTFERELSVSALSLDDADPVSAMRARGFALLGAAQLRGACGVDEDALRSLEPSWSDLPPDTHLRDRGGYRYRRHASYMLDLADGTLTRMPHRAHWQPVDYNALHGGIERWFQPVDPGLDAYPAWAALLRHLGLLFAEAAAHDAPDLWFIEAHQFRIDTANGIGRPTPEGAHRDGVDYVAVILIHRHQVRGGETRVFPLDSPLGVRFTLVEPWTALLMDDARVIHETTPILPLDPDGARNAWRDTLVITYRRGGFQDPAGEQRTE